MKYAEAATARTELATTQNQSLRDEIEAATMEIFLLPCYPGRRVRIRAEPDWKPGEIATTEVCMAQTSIIPMSRAQRACPHWNISVIIRTKVTGWMAHPDETTEPITPLTNQKHKRGMATQCQGSIHPQQHLLIT